MWAPPQQEVVVVVVVVIQQERTGTHLIWVGLCSPRGRASKLIDCPNQLQVRLALEFINLLFMAIIIFGAGGHAVRQAGTDLCYSWDWKFNMPPILIYSEWNTALTYTKQNLIRIKWDHRLFGNNLMV